MQNTSPVDPALTQELERFAARYPFPLDAFQREAIEQLAQDRSVVVTAPTGTGKTIVAEYAIWRALQHHQHVIYTTPLKALSNQKYRDFRTLYGVENVGLLTGDVSEQRLAPIVVMTTEVYRNMLLEADRAQQIEREHETFSLLSKIGFLIFDELHYISDTQRGPVWEEAIICTPEHIQLVGLSATVSNASELVDWISRVHRPAALVSHDQRAIPLEHYYLLDGTLHLVQDAQGQRVARFPHVGGEARATLRQPGHRSFSLNNRDEETMRGPHKLRSQKRQARASAQMHHLEPASSASSPTSARRKPHQLPTVDDILAVLEQADFLPCLYFLPGRRLVEETARGVSLQSFTSPDEQELILHEIEQWRESLSREDRELPQVRTLTDLLPRGIAFHHAGLLPGLKVVVETLFVRGHLRVVFATDTLALGVNMPARAVVVGSLSKFDGERMRLLTPNEYRQLTGRAGRRGLDVRGAAIIPYSPWEPFEDAFARITGEQLPVTSAFSIRYNTVLNLWRPNNVEVLEYVCAASLCEYQRAGQRQQRELQRTLRSTQRAAGKKKNRQTRARPVVKADVVPLDFPALSSVGEAELEGIIATLRTLDYIGRDEQLTLKGHLLRRIFHPAGILVNVSSG